MAEVDRGENTGTNGEEEVDVVGGYPLNRSRSERGSLPWVC